MENRVRKISPEYLYIALYLHLLYKKDNKESINKLIFLYTPMYLYKKQTKEAIMID